jgi:hypothetical protein
MSRRSCGGSCSTAIRASLPSPTSWPPRPTRPNACRSCRCPQTLWTGRRLEEAPADLLAGPVVLKANNGCGTNVIVEDGKPGAEELVARGHELMAARWRTDEWAYGQIEPMLFLEQWLPLDTGTMPMDIKVYIACGVPANVWTADRKGQRSLTLDPEGNPGARPRFGIPARRSGPALFSPAPALLPRGRRPGAGAGGGNRFPAGGFPRQRRSTLCRRTDGLFEFRYRAAWPTGSSSSA